ncbi:hypothetical protein A6V39_00390 [Candidatus Mycoplasma haematobovis]|uniref:Uncharacterized protein n=1 Tax=Candidatus Mycoplasma haematobovis TaxID=432608 RepID=A0A1A9QE42_9MOLU|nr:hypothetical protein [Candidatus Mycoplasma haematobovis]OAL10508.1 hypothetical protein A6V39_00390 [Candidatus Mycoplasma haematobovis]
MALKPILTAIAGVGTIGGVATGSYYLLRTNEDNKDTEIKVVTPKSLLQELAGDDFEKLNTATDNPEHDKEWGELIKKYLNPGNIKKINLATPITAGDGKTADNILALKNACKTLLQKSENIVDKDKEMARNWCNKKSALIPKATEGSLPRA